MSCEVTLSGIHATLGRRQVLRDLDLVAPAGKVTVVMGESGSGKTTLLRLVAGLQPAEKGAVHFDGKAITHRSPHERGVAMAFQNYSLYPGQTVARNLELPLIARSAGAWPDRLRLWRRHLAERLERWPGIAARIRTLGEDPLEKQVTEMLRRLGIGELARRAVGRLSGGEQQRVALGRALIRRPRVLLLDEPLSNVDPARQQEIVGLLQELFEEYRPTTLLVTHDWHEAVLLGHWIAVLRDGRIVQQGLPRDIYENPQDLHVLAFSQQGLLNRLDGLRSEDDGRLVANGGRIVAKASSSVRVGCYSAVFRSEHLRPCGPGQGWEARVRSVRPAAGSLLLELEGAGRRWFAATELGMAEPDRRLRVALVPGSGWLADEAGCFVSRLRSLEVRT